MFHWTIIPRFSETDGLGHINNTAIPVWFEEARTPIFQIFIPTLDMKKWNLILAKIEIEFVSQLHHGHEVDVRTSLHRIGNSSFELGQEAWQQDAVGARGKATLVHFDYQTQKPVSIPDSIREQLMSHLESVERSS